jgi:hypothetical protein
MPRATTQWDRETQLARAERTLEAKLTELKRLVTSIRLWQRRVKYYTGEVHKSDEQRAAERVESAARREQRARRQRRIKL